MRTNVTILASLALFAFGTGCSSSAGSDADSDISSATEALIADHDEMESTEQDVEGSLEQPLSGAPTDLAPAEPEDDDAGAASAVSNAGLYFRPSGCIQSTRDGNVVTHVFTDCTGPRGLVHMTGTVTSTWSREADAVKVVHATTGFTMNGASIDHTATLTLSRKANGAGSQLFTMHRVGSTSGTTQNGMPIAHSADYTTTWEPTTRCTTRNGSSNTTLEGREFSRSIEGYERCGVGQFGCPRSGTFKLNRPNLAVELEFTGGRSYELSVNRRRRTRQMLWCVAN